MRRLVVSDTSPLRALDCVGKLDLLGKLFGTVLIPPAVSRELQRADCWSRLQDWVEVRNPNDAFQVRALRRSLDEGESEAIVLALEVGADFVLMDELKGRRELSKAGLPAIGFLGVLLRAKSMGHLAMVMPLVQRVITEMDFYISGSLLEDVRRRAGE